MADELSLLAALLAAFAAGLLSFLSPCVLPLVSSYLVFLSGENADSSPGLAPARLVIPALCFVLGFSSVFIVLSLLFSGLFFFLGKINTIINIIAGSIVVVFGLNILFDFIPFLNYEKRFHAGRPRGGRSAAGSFAVGLAFGAGWMPCVGPILGSILLLAGQSGKLGLSAVYLILYSAGLGLPFLLAAVFWASFLKYIAKIKKALPLIKTVSGIFLVAMGIFIMTGRFKQLSAFFLKNGYALSRWAAGGHAAVILIPALIFFLIALSLPLFRFIKKKKLLSPGPLIFTGIFLLLTLAQLFGLMNFAALLARWLQYSG
jgi:cytochrome c-type biogenesis protein